MNLNRSLQMHATRDYEKLKRGMTMELGKIQTLEVQRITKIGAFLNKSKGERLEEDVLLPNNQISEALKVGEALEVFLYKDSEDRYIVTRKIPKITLGEIAKLKVIENGKFGAFMDWGLEKDLLLPFKEQRVPVKEGSEYLVVLYIDKSHRLCASMHIQDVLSKDSPYKQYQKVVGTVHAIVPEFGAYIAVDNRYDALIPSKELYRELSIGDEIEARVKQVRQNGRLELSLRKETLQQIDVDLQTILEALEKSGGKLPYHDKTDPQKIKQAFAMSKAAFKRAVGRLYKEKRILMTDEGIEFVSGCH